GHLERGGQLVLQPLRADRDAAGDHELPQPEILQVQRVEAAFLQPRPADVDAVVYPVRLLLLEVVRIHRLRGLFLEIDVRGDSLGDPGHALVEVPALGVDSAHAWIDGASIRLDALADAGAEALK